MAEVQKTTSESGEMTQRFIEFVMMTAQQSALFLGQIPNPQTGEAEVNLELAKLFIDQLVMIRSKTQGNLNDDETKVLNNAISNLQLAFYEVSQQQRLGGSGESSPPASEPAPEPAAESAGSHQPEQPAQKEETPAPAADDFGSKKKFSKSYGA